MKNSVRVAMFLSLMVGLVLATPVVAQQNSYTIQVPFSFKVDARVFPAGEYRVGVISPGAVQIRGVDNTASAMLVTTFVSGSNSKRQNSELVFHQYGEEHFLAQVWFEDIGAGYKLHLSKTEREYAQGMPRTDTVLRAKK